MSGLITTRPMSIAAAITCADPARLLTPHRFVSPQRAGQEDPSAPHEAVWNVSASLRACSWDSAREAS
jgi:hypothetical protein